MKAAIMDMNNCCTDEKKCSSFISLVWAFANSISDQVKHHSYDRELVIREHNCETFVGHVLGRMQPLNWDARAQHCHKCSAQCDCGLLSISLHSQLHPKPVAPERGASQWKSSADLWGGWIPWWYILWYTGASVPVASTSSNHNCNFSG